jgi:hypothetical protein
MRKPEQPQGVRIHRASGEVVECEVIYEGKERQRGLRGWFKPRLNMWVITSWMAPGDVFSVDFLPGHSSVLVRGAVPPEGEPRFVEIPDG